MAAVKALIFLIAVWRGTTMMTYEDGPFSVLSRFRQAVGAEFNGNVVLYEEASQLGRLFQCPYCLSVWFGLALFVLHKTFPTVAEIIIYALGASAVTVGIEEIRDGSLRN